METIQDKLKSVEEIIPVILAGGRGTRLWPLSRSCYPKQFQKLDEGKDFSLFQNTYLRLQGIKNLDRPIILCNEEHRFIVAEQMREIDIKPKSIILEPVSRNTAPAIALAALKVLKDGNPNSILLILSADHIIDNAYSFKDSIEIGYDHAKAERLVTFGIKPSHPETGYGYIESSEEISLENKSSSIKKFIEKPIKEVAEKLIRNNLYSWNSGIFLFKTSIIINEIKKFYPEITSICEDSIKKDINDFEFQRINEEIFKNCPNISIDKAVMENTSLGTVTQLDAGWSDIGNWKALWERSEKDQNKNKCIGKTLIKDCNNCYIRSEKRLTVGLGIKNLAVIETVDAVLVADINELQKVKDLVSELDSKNFQESKINNLANRPWGSFTTIEESKNWKVKRIKINPGASISLQLHKHRSEHWVVVSGIAKVEIGEHFSEIKQNESIFVPRECKHRLSNHQKIPLVIIEIQSGSYLGEDDIIRFNDLYGRT